MKCLSAIILAAATIGFVAHTARAQQITWSGYDWTVRTGAGGPGNNVWNKDNVQVDGTGTLHLKISNAGRVWSCAEIYTNQKFGYGTYQFFVTGAIDQLDKNVVLGLFSYPTADVGPDGTNEIDIEMSRWGNPSTPMGSYTVYPNTLTAQNVSQVYAFRLLHNLDTTQRYTWKEGSIAFQSLHGHTNGNTREYSAWSTPRSFSKLVGSQAMPVHLNLWLFQSNPPSDSKPVEVLIKAFKFAP
jgi:hypothetical protein